MNLLQNSLFDLTPASSLPASAMWAPDIRRVARGEALSQVVAHHYAGGIHGGPVAWGCFDGEDMKGVCAFATPCSEAVRASVFGADHKDAVIELHRLAIEDGHPKNFTSWFVARCIERLLEHRPQTRAIVSFADQSEGHTGAIYRALNFTYSGTTGSRRRFWRDREGRLRHPRQNGVNVTAEAAAARGWVAEYRDPKHRYVLVVGPDKRERRRFKRLLRWDTVDLKIKK